jgi:hypothetical protein
MASPWVRAHWGSALEAGLADARASRKPLLVLVVPSDLAAARTRGEFLGEVLEAADEEFLIDLACCEVVCAPASELHRLTTELLLPADPLAVLFTYGEHSVAARSVHVAPYSDLARVAESEGVVVDCERACQLALQQLIRTAGSREALAADAPGMPTACSPACAMEHRFRPGSSIAGRRCSRSSPPARRSTRASYASACSPSRAAS